MSDFKQLEAQDNSSLQELLLRNEIPRYGNKEFELWQVQFWLREVFHGWEELSAEIPYLGHCRSPSITEVFPSLSQQWCRRAALQCRGLNKVVLRSLPLLIFCSFFENLGCLKENQLLHVAGDSHPYPGAAKGKCEVKYAVSDGAHFASVSAKADSDSSCGSPIQIS